MISMAIALIRQMGQIGLLARFGSLGLRRTNDAAYIEERGEQRLMETRQLKQYGWISGPVECCCTTCDWSANFIAVDSSIPASIVKAFAKHDCAEYSWPNEVTRKRA
jgi:hypothetical protein